MSTLSIHTIICDRAVPGFEPGDIRTACRNGVDNPSGLSLRDVYHTAISQGWIADEHYGRAICPCCQWRRHPGDAS